MRFPVVIPIAFDRAWREISMIFYRLRSPILAWLWGVECKGRVLFQGPTYIRVHHKGQIVLGDHVVFNAQARTNLVGLLGPTYIDTRVNGRLEVGDYSGFSSCVISSRERITIGARVKVGGNVRIFDHDFHSLDAAVRRTSQDRLNVRSKSVVIEDDCFIGTNAMILKGTHLGARTIVAAGSVVFGLDVPPDSLVKGNPAVVVLRKGSV